METCAIPECYRPCYERGGFVHDFCGRTHASEAVARGMLQSLKPPHGSCHRCQLHGCASEVYYDEETDTVHDFCCRRHADLAMSRGEWPPYGSRGSYQCRREGCGEYVYRNPTTGEESEYCSRSHASEHASESENEMDQQAPMCDHPQCESHAWVLDDSANLAHPYCSSRCAAAMGLSYLVGPMECSMPGCIERTLLDIHTGADLGYCSDDHQVRAEERSLCPNTEPFVDRTFRGGTSANDFRLSVLTNQHSDYADLKKQFFTKWEKPDNGITVERIFKIQVPEDVLQKHNNYKAVVGNTRRRFHGTSCSADCNFYVDLRGGPCGRPDCSVCSICTHGFKLSGFNGRTAQQTNFNLRYGQGLYFSSVSGKANDYAHQSEKICGRGKKWRCMFMASVTVGNPFPTQEGRLPEGMCPPLGYDSVLGETGFELNHDEVAVYNEDAALPTFLIVYSTF